MKPSKRVLRFLSTAVCTFGLGVSVLGYDPKGHETVGAIADELIHGTSAETHVKALLNQGETLLIAATWADRAKATNLTDPEMISFTNSNPAHHSYHFTDIPIQEPLYREDSIGATNVDIVHVMKQCIQVLQGNDTPTTNPHGFSQKIALRLLVHYVGDIHQPLHVGAAYLSSRDRFINPNVGHRSFDADQGGNFLAIDHGQLHHFWDNNAVTNAMAHAGATSPLDYANKILLNNPVVAQTLGDVTTWPKQWADEIMPIAAKAHKRFRIGHRTTVTEHSITHLQWKVTLPSGYETFARDTVDERITTAGERLAQLLMTIWP